MGEQSRLSTLPEVNVLTPERKLLLWKAASKFQRTVDVS
jgi:hypothetical protein